jgi:hypothetical protein
MSDFDPLRTLEPRANHDAMGRHGDWNWKRDFGLGLILTPTILLCIPVLAALADPKILVREWQFFVPFVILPYAVGIGLLVSAHRSKEGR